MEPDIGLALTCQLKRELAERFFGQRKLIEEDKAAFAGQVREHTLTLEQSLCTDLARLYILLRDEDLIQSFLAVVGLEQLVCYDPYFRESRQLQERLLRGFVLRGFTQRGRFRRLVFLSYDQLAKDVAAYREGLDNLAAQRELINEEIVQFYRQNDLGEILQFLRSLECGQLAGGLAVPGTCAPADELDRRLLLTPVVPLEEIFPVVPALPQLAAVRGRLSRLADAAFGRHRRVFAGI
ncbi:MAG: hypothetical protein AB1634_02540 [Thermodesulfobacteriota bacterium]